MSGPEPPPGEIEVTFTRHEIVPLAAARELSAWERELIGRIAAHDDTLGLPGMHQLERLRVVEECRTCATVTLSAGPRARRIPTSDPRHRGRWGVVSRNTFVASDTDGMEVFAVLHIADGLISELEVARMDGEPLLALPTPGEFGPATIVP